MDGSEKSVIIVGFDCFLLDNFPVTSLFWLDSFNGSDKAFKSALVVALVLNYPTCCEFDLPNDGLKILPGLL